MNADTEHFLDNITRLDSATRKRFQNSCKVFVTGSRGDVRVPMREISLTDTITDLLDAVVACLPRSRWQAALLDLELREMQDGFDTDYVGIVLLAATFSGTASNEPELTPEAMAEQIDPGIELSSEEELPQEPLAELGVAPGTGPVEETDAEPDPEIIIEDDADDS